MKYTHVFILILVGVLVAAAGAYFAETIPKITQPVLGVSAEQIVLLVNSFRTANKIPTLKESALMDDAALKRAVFLGRKNSTLDTQIGTDFLSADGYSYSAENEDDAFLQPGNTNENIVDSLTGNGVARSHILSTEYTEIGVGVSGTNAVILYAKPN